MAFARGVRHVFLDMACRSWGVFFGMEVTAQTVSWWGAAQQRTRYRPFFERLEDRTVPTTVTTQPQLIAAINAANTAGGAQTISLGADITLF